jgi:uncharacterized protein YacL
VNPFAFVVGLSVGVGVGNLFVAHYLRNMSWPDSFMFGALALIVNVVLCVIAAKLGFLKA